MLSNLKMMKRSNIKATRLKKTTKKVIHRKLNIKQVQKMGYQTIGIRIRLVLGRLSVKIMKIDLTSSQVMSKSLLTLCQAQVMLIKI